MAEGRARFRLDLVAKGLCMGAADVIPGVSGGTLALILGIYEPFIRALGSLGPAPILPTVRWLASGLDDQRRQEAAAAWRTVHLGFLIPLGLGIGTALVIGSAVIPPLLERHPEVMRGLFFGLIVASVGVPIGKIPRSRPIGFLLAGVAAVGFAAGGYWLTDPNRLVDASNDWVEVGADGGTDLEHLLRAGPSALTSEQVYWSARNAPLREAIRATSPGHADELDALHAAVGAAVVTDKDAVRARSEPYNSLPVPAGAVVHVPRPALWYTFLAGSIAICAMVLPGISGSFLLLVLGMYYFVLNAAKGALSGLLHLEVGASVLYLLAFASGIVVGILGFTRVLAFLLQRAPAVTMGALAGLMVGCLRAIWPFQDTVDGRLANVWPATWGGTETLAVVAAGIGVVTVLVLSAVGRRTRPLASGDAA